MEPEQLNTSQSDVASRAMTVRKRYLRRSFEPTNWTVICGRGKECFDHIGNRRFRVICQSNLKTYSTAKTKIEKSLIVMKIVDVIRESSGFGGFVKQESSSKLWYEVPDNACREKVGQQLRELLTRKDPAKIQRRRARRRMQARQRFLAQLGADEDCSSTHSQSGCSTDTSQSPTGVGAESGDFFNKDFFVLPNDLIDTAEDDWLGNNETVAPAVAVAAPPKPHCCACVCRCCHQGPVDASVFAAV